MAIRLLLSFLTLWTVTYYAAGCSQKQDQPHSTSTGTTAREIVLVSNTPNTSITSQQVESHGVSSAPQSSSIVFGKDGGVAFVVEEGPEQLRAVLNGKPEAKTYKEIGSFSISPNGKRLAYFASKEGKYLAVVDGKEGPLYDEVYSTTFSPDSKHVLYDIVNGGKGYLVVDGKLGEPYLSNYAEYFSGDSTKVISIENATKDGDRHRIVVTDTLLKNRKAIESANSEYAFNNKDRLAAVDRLPNGKKRAIVLDINDLENSKTGSEYDEIIMQAFAPDGVNIVYVGIKGDKPYLVLNGKEELLPEGQVIPPLAARPDLKAASLIMVDKSGPFLYEAFTGGVKDAKRYTEAANPTYSPDGSRLVYVAKQGADVFVVVNGKPGPVYDIVVDPRWSPDGKRLIYRARKDGRRFVVVADEDGKTLQEHQKYNLVYEVNFTADGKSVQYGVKDGDKLLWRVVPLP